MHELHEEGELRGGGGPKRSTILAPIASILGLVLERREARVKLERLLQVGTLQPPGILVTGAPSLHLSRRPACPQAACFLALLHALDRSYYLR